MLPLATPRPMHPGACVVATLGADVRPVTAPCHTRAYVQHGSCRVKYLVQCECPYSDTEGI
jgi:hypothetical protein